MLVKKYDKVNLEKKKGLFFQLGLIAAISVAIFLFEFGTEKENYNYYEIQATEVDLEVEQLFIKKKDLEKTVPKTSVLKEIKMIFDAEETEDTTTIDAEISEAQIIDFELLDYPEEEEEIFDEIWYFVEKKPEFPGGETALKHYIANNIKYPETALSKDIQGRVYVKFIINKEGKIEDAKVVKGVDELLDNEALRVINAMPDWEPGMNNGIKVSVWFSLPVNFILY